MIATATPTQIALHEARKARMARMARMAAKVNDNEKPRVIASVPKPEPKQSQKIEPMQEPQPVQMEPLDASNMTRRQYARLRAQQFGYTMEELIAGGRKRDVIKVKHQIMYEVKTLFPNTSYPMVAEIFGLSDHATVIYVVDKIENGIPERQRKPRERAIIHAHNRTPDHIRDEVVEMYRAGADSKASIGRAFDISPATVLAILRERGEISR